MAFELPPLPYDYDALEPHIDAQTMQIHHDKHHAAYVNNLNDGARRRSPSSRHKSVEDLIAQSQRRAREDPHRRPQQRRRPRQPHAVLGDHDSRRRRRADRRAGRGDQHDLRRLRRSSRSSSPRPAPRASAAAGPGSSSAGRQASRRCPARQPGQPADGRPDTPSSASTSGSTPTTSSTRTAAPDYVAAWWNVRQLGQGRPALSAGRRSLTR